MPNELVVKYRYVCHIMYDLVMLFQAPFSKAPSRRSSLLRILHCPQFNVFITGILQRV